MNGQPLSEFIVKKSHSATDIGRERKIAIDIGEGQLSATPNLEVDIPNAGK